MRRNFASLVLLSLLVRAALSGPAGPVLRFEGNRALDDETLAALSPPLAPGDAAALEGLLDSLTRGYRRRGYLNAALSAQPAGGDTLRVTIREGRRARLAALSFSGNAKLSADTLAHAAGFKPGEPFDAGRADEIQERALRACADRGYPFAEVRLKAASVESSGVRLDFEVKENGRYYFGAIRVAGTPRTRPATFERMARIRENAPYAETDFIKIRERWMQSGLFESVDSLRLFLRPGQRVLDIRTSVREAPVNSAEGVLGYDPTAPGSGLSGALDLSLANIAGTFRRLTVSYRQETPVTRAEAAFTEPWLFGTRAEAEVAVSYRAEDPLFTAQSGRLRLSFPLSDRLKIHAGLSRAAHTALQGAGGSDTLPLTTRTTLSEAGLTLDTRDRPDNPARGTLLRLPLSAGLVATRGVSGRIVRTESLLEQCVPLVGRHLLFLGLRYAGVSAPAAGLPLSEEPVLGGTATLRGFREEAFRGRGVLSSRAEYRFLPDKGSRLLLFFDAGVCDKHSPALAGIDAREDLLYGYGAGLHVSTRAGLLGLEYGLSRETPLTNGKIHVAFRNRF